MNTERLNTENVGAVRLGDWPECNQFLQVGMAKLWGCGSIIKKV
jgi:hypothetical protein